jgi:hypothetical protein
MMKLILFFSLILALNTKSLFAQVSSSKELAKDDLELADESIEASKIDIVGEYKLKPELKSEEKLNCAPPKEAAAVKILTVQPQPSQKSQVKEVLKQEIMNEEKKVQPKENMPDVISKQLPNQEIAYEEVKVKPMSQTEKIRAYRAKLEDRNIIYLEKKIEQIRFRQEMALAKKLENSMNQTLKALDNI